MVQQDGIIGSSTLLSIYNATVGTPVPVGEIESFSVKSQTEMKKRFPIGQVQPNAQLFYDGYELSIKGIKIDGSWEDICAANDSALLAGQAAPRYRIVQTTTMLDGTVEIWQYDKCLIYGFNIDAAAGNEIVKEDFSGWAPSRSSGSAAGIGVLSSLLA